VTNFKLSPPFFSPKVKELIHYTLRAKISKALHCNFSTATRINHGLESCLVAM